jgi:hypothetical protein
LNKNIVVKTMSENSRSKLDMFLELSCYTSSHGDPEFIHQYVVDAFALEYADENTKNIKVAFALIGLYLHIEKNFTGKEVQNAHVKLGKKRKNWPKFSLPAHRGEFGIKNVIACPNGFKRDMAIEEWCLSVWLAYSCSHEDVRKLVREELWENR